MTLTEKYKKEVSDIKLDADEITRATNYTANYLIRGTSCDSSSRAKIRANYVMIAENIIKKQHKKEILKLAADLCLKGIG